MPRYTLPVPIECGVETCFVGVGEPCGMVSQTSSRCLHFIEPLKMSSGWYQRLPDCIAQAVPVESADALGPIQKLRNLMNALADDSMEMSDEEIEAEVRAEGLDPQEVAQRMRERGRALAEGARESPAEEGERCALSDCQIRSPSGGERCDLADCRLRPDHPATPEQEGERVGTWTVEDDHAEGWDCSGHGHWLHGQERCPVFVGGVLCGATRPQTEEGESHE